MTDRVKIHDLVFKPMIKSDIITAAVDKVAAQISRDYASAEQPPIVISILNGAFIFTSDLCRGFDFCAEVSFVKYSSYDGVSTTGAVKSLIGLNRSIEGRDVIVVDDIVDSGNTIVHIDTIIKEMNPKSVRYCALFFKPSNYKQSLKIDYTAMNIGEEFIVGYGLDYNEQGRNLKDIYVVCNE